MISDFLRKDNLDERTEGDQLGAWDVSQVADELGGFADVDDAHRSGKAG